ncbi:MAG: redox-regulated ATPase YchF [Bacteroidales bacterium]|nr:redox-regulated ATPase YchF [Bacteroidales bacterium]MDD2323810.1 redox-regulated ATPase YchF [Bacteroidales bacterium]MDD3011242.1 redox-regulated ATPase YchF [Bacteroidales bacterium]MDD3962590.1 redox-regulated ATPase YchF [Bacteroidales bacterium]MDY0286060.1 redox-regulated ATPase YchF [Bacteroidales bacterium]
MGLNCGIIGLTNTGKTTIFNCISNNKAEATSYAFSATKSNIGMIEVPDPRLDAIDALVHSARVVHATVDIIDLPGLAKGASKGEGVGNKFLADVQQTDALIHVLRCFDDDNLAHVEGSIDPVRDIEIVDFELQVRDLDLVQRKIQRTEKLVKVGDKEAKKTMEILNKYVAHFENFGNARDMSLDEEERKVVKELMLLTEKPVLFVCNVDEKSAVDGNAYSKAVQEYLKDSGATVLVIAGALEADIAQLESADDRNAFLEDAGLSEPGVNKMIRAAYAMLNLQSFFTAGPKEVRAWTIKKGMTAPEAAGVIHSDLERGFIRAEVIKLSDFLQLKSEHACKEKGKLSVEGKNYIVQDGDMLNIRFNV